MFFPENENDWKSIADGIERSVTIYMTTHVNPDGDAIGSEMALARFLGRMGKTVRVLNQSPTPIVYRFLDPEDTIEVFDEDTPATMKPTARDAVIFLDFGTIKRAGACGEFLNNSPALKIVIDHHPPEYIEVDLFVINTQAASTGSLVYDFMCSTDQSLIDKVTALSILTAVVTDTGYFRYSNTTATTHRIAASLYEYGIAAPSIRRHLEIGYPFARQKLLGLTLSTVRLASGGKIAYAFINETMFREAGAVREHTDGIIDHIRSIQDVKIAILIIQETPDKFKVSFRSGDGTTVNEIARALGGGGHLKAAGANVTGSLGDVITRVVDEAVKTLS